MIEGQTIKASLNVQSDFNTRLAYSPTLIGKLASGFSVGYRQMLSTTFNFP